MFKEGSIGLPFPDTYIKIVKPGTDEELPYGEEGEILLAGPTAMKRYMDNPEETANTLRKHADGLTWVYTGDLGKMDNEGFIYFKGRAKRMIVSSGYNGAPRGEANCIDTGICERERLKVPKGERYELCVAVHAEQNAIINGDFQKMRGATIYIVGRNVADGSYASGEPCLLCRRMIKNAQIAKVICRNPAGEIVEVTL